MDSKKNLTARLLSPATLSLLFGAAFAGDVSAMEPAVNDSIKLGNALAIATDTQNQNQNQNQNQDQILSAFKPGALRQIDAELALS